MKLGAKLQKLQSGAVGTDGKASKEFGSKHSLTTACLRLLTVTISDPIHGINITEISVNRTKFTPNTFYMAINGTFFYVNTVAPCMVKKELTGL